MSWTMARVSGPAGGIYRRDQAFNFGNDVMRSFAPA
jgi:hypothetical protein